MFANCFEQKAKVSLPPQRAGVEGESHVLGCGVLGTVSNQHNGVHTARTKDN